MKFANGYKLTPFCVLPGCACFLSVANASDVDDLRALLHGFLVTADEEAAHRRFTERIVSATLRALDGNARKIQESSLWGEQNLRLALDAAERLGRLTGDAP